MDSSGIVRDLIVFLGLYQPSCVTLKSKSFLGIFFSLGRLANMLVAYSAREGKKTIEHSYNITTIFVIFGSLVCSLSVLCSSLLLSYYVLEWNQT